MRDLPDPAATSSLVLLPSRVRWVPMVVVAAAVIATGTVLAVRGTATEGRVVGGVLAVLFLVIAVGSVMKLVPGLSHLRLSADGIEVRFAGRSTLRRWSDVDRAEVHGVGQYRRVDVRMRGGVEALYLVDGHGLPLRDLAELINRWHEHFDPSSG